MRRVALAGVARNAAVCSHASRAVSRYQTVVNLMKVLNTILVVTVLGTTLSTAYARDNTDELGELRQLITNMRIDYEQRISDLEERLARAEQVASGARRDAEEAIELSEETAIGQSSSASAANTFNPALGAVLQGTYGRVKAGWEQIPGFAPAGEIGTGDSGFALGEAEINLKANVDDRFYGNLTAALASEDGETEVELEEAWLQTTGLQNGLTVTGGRFFSAAGYLNSFHFHADDFVDRPLPYQAFLGGRYSVDGLRASWIAPTMILFEIGAEANWGGSFPATTNEETSPGAWTLFANIGGDVGDSNSWQLGLAYIDADAVERNAAEDGGGEFSGDSDLSIVDFVWKWAPAGNPNVRNLKVQAEYFRRDETGLFDSLAYDGEQDGWYLQGVWQFAPLWRVGLRHDYADADNGSGFAGTELEDPGRSAHRSSAMLDWSPSEFSRLRLQYTNDQVLAETDNQWYLQYIMSIGAHGAHRF